MNYRFRAAKSFWRSWSKLSEDQQQTARKAFPIFMQDPFDPRLRISDGEQRPDARGGSRDL